MMKWICLLREFSSMLEEWNMFKVLQIARLQSFFQYCSEYSENKLPVQENAHLKKPETPE